jgi:Rrf2 family protein
MQGNMKISTKGRYALRMLLDLAEHQNEGYVALKDIADRQEISKKYLEQIVPMLSKAGVLLTSRGYQGGYRLAKTPKDYTVGDILRITEGSLAPVSCLDTEENTCERASNCMTLGVWKGLNDVINEYLDSITLQNIIDDYRAVASDEYYI